jgi:hypothetical protein
MCIAGSFSFQSAPWNEHDYAIVSSMAVQLRLPKRCSTWYNAHIRAVRIRHAGHGSQIECLKPCDMNRPLLQVLFIETLPEAAARYGIDVVTLESLLVGKTQRLRGDGNAGYYSVDVANAVAAWKREAA